MVTIISTAVFSSSNSTIEKIKKLCFICTKNPSGLLLLVVLFVLQLLLVVLFLLQLGHYKLPETAAHCTGFPPVVISHRLDIMHAYYWSGIMLEY